MDTLQDLKTHLEENHSGVMRYIDEIIAQQTRPMEHVLSVPWLSQLGPDGGYASGDCGPACLAMWLRFLGWDVTVDNVSQHTGLERGYRYSMPAHIIHAARHWDVNLYWRRFLTIDDIKAEIDAGQPAIVLVHYAALPDHVRFDKSYTAGHWILVTGYSSTAIAYLDPYFVERGKKTITIAEFLSAWSTNYLDGNSNKQALRLR